MKFKPNGNWILLPDPTMHETDSGIILDDKTAQANARKANVLEALAFGHNCIFVEKGDTVMVDPRTEAIITTIEDAKYLMVAEHQILGKM